jgi:hypothetical protein
MRQITKDYPIPRRFVTIPNDGEVVKAIEWAGLQKSPIIADADVQKVVQHLKKGR